MSETKQANSINTAAPASDEVVLGADDNWYWTPAAHAKFVLLKSDLKARDEEVRRLESELNIAKNTLRADLNLVEENKRLRSLLGQALIWLDTERHDEWPGYGPFQEQANDALKAEVPRDGEKDA